MRSRAKRGHHEGNVRGAKGRTETRYEPAQWTAAKDPLVDIAQHNDQAVGPIDNASSTRLT